ncbi:glycosyltransferase [Microvirga flavescens]|uniref:glycosyltransferase n=1 Tax=Microvirga flavescens TaxID=2249811 RepID=UPI000DD915C1|nr:glycosyltransferase [Microvirga flavescens]
MLSTEASSGGAPRAMQRLAKGLRARGHTVDVFVAGAVHDPAHEIKISRAADGVHETHFIRAGSSFLDYDYVTARRTALSNTCFSTQIYGFDIASNPVFRSYDILNVHWTGFMMSPQSLGDLIDLGIPTLFTLHDMAHFTGGCHYSAGCKGFEAQCNPCHQVSPDELGLVRYSLEAKRKRYGKPNVHAISPSAWLAEQANGSGVFQKPVQVIRNSIETDIFRVARRQEVRRELGLDDNTRAILFGVYDNSERRKGYAQLLGTLQRCLADPEFSELVRAGQIRFLSFGKSDRDLEELGVPFINLGWVDNDRRLSEIYNAADLCVLPSIEDNQPNVMLEAMACGTPVIAFRIGGIPETVVDAQNGRLIEPFDLDGMSSAIVEMVGDLPLLRRMGWAAASVAKLDTLNRQAAAYEQAFAQALSASSWQSCAAAETLATDDDGVRTIAARLQLEPIASTKPIKMALEKLARLEEELAAVDANRNSLLAQLVDVNAQLRALQEHSAQRDAELNVLKGKLINKVILKLRHKLRSRLQSHRH